jgi:hypothetical protein
MTDPPDALTSAAAIAKAGCFAEVPSLPILNGVGETTLPTAESVEADPPHNILELPRGVEPPEPPEPPDEEGWEPPPESPLAALRFFYAQTVLTDEDLERKLWQPRSLTPEFCQILGFRSSRREYAEILREMGKQFPPEALLISGLWTRGNQPGAEARPNPQYCGWGVVGKKEGEWLWDWSFPILIPYLNRYGDLIDLLPHKRMQRGQSPRLYIPRPLRAYRQRFKPSIPGFALVSEGAFKVAAVFQALHDCGAFAAVPGITMAKPLYCDIEMWLDESSCRKVVVAYDNEEKGDPNLPGFKAERHRRFDSEIWARYLCHRLLTRGFEGRVGHLPNGLRDEKGKADWDGVMALLAGSGRVSLAGAAETWERVREKVRSEFLRVINGALDLKEVGRAGLYASEDEKIIFREFKRFTFERKMPPGGDDEANLAKRLDRLCSRAKGDEERLPAKARSYLRVMAHVYRETVGCYYVCRPLADKERDYWQQLQAKAHGRDDVELRRACEMVLRGGMPEVVSDFVMEPLFALRKFESPAYELLVRIHSVHGKVFGPLVLPPESFCAPKEYRRWLMTVCPGAAWMIGERPLQLKHRDTNALVIHKEVQEVALRGAYEAAGLWCFRGVAYGADGREIFPDRQGVIWYEGKGYLLAERDQEGEEFRQHEPDLKPRVEFTPAQTRELFQELSQKLRETIGDDGGYLALGAVLAYAAGLEIYQKWIGFPLLWIYGLAHQGKTSLARWLMRIWGFNLQEGTVLSDTTQVGMAILLQQNGNLPVWFEEHQETSKTLKPWLPEKIKSIFDRNSGSKKTFGEAIRRVRTSAIITGVSTSDNSQVRSRCAHVMVSASHRRANHFRWFEDESLAKFCFLGRYLMRNRPEFARITMAQLDAWMKSRALLNCEDRTRLVHGVAYAAFSAASALLDAAPAERLNEFKNFLCQHAETAAGELQDREYVVQHFYDIVSATSAGEMGATVRERQELFKAVEVPGPGVELSPRQLALAAQWPCAALSDYVLYWAPRKVYDRVAMWRRRQGKEMPMSFDDLKSAMQTQPWWLPPPRGQNGSHVQKFAGGPQRCFGLVVNVFPVLGYCAVPDDVLEESLNKINGLGIASGDWTDPRKGDLFTLINALKKKDE